MSRSRAQRRAEKRAAANADKRAAKLRGGPDESGNYGPNPYGARGQMVEMAPKHLGKELPKDSQFPKRIAYGIDWYAARGYIDAREAKAAETLLQFWTEADMQAKTTAGYDPVMVQSSPSMDGRLVKYLDAALGYTRLMRAVPYRCQGVIRAVVIEGSCSASEWARSRGIGERDSKAYGLKRLRAGLQALAASLGY